MQRVVAGYAGDPLNGCSYLTATADGRVLVVVTIGQVRDQHFADAGLVVRLEHDMIIIDHDVNNKPLVDALLAAGIPRSQIILAYAGETTHAAA